MSSSLTKEQLKSYLINYGVPPPPSSAKKEEYQKLFDEHVAPTLSSKGDFSSDDEPDTSSVNNSISTVETIHQNGTSDNGISNGEVQPEEVSSMSDEDLFSRLRDAGVNIGPVTSTTRGLYQKKLAQVLKGGSTPVPPSPLPQPTVPSIEAEYSDNEEVDIVLKVQDSDFSLVVEDVGTNPSIEHPEEFTNVRLRPRNRTEDLAVGHLIPAGRGPTPRPTIREARGDLEKDYLPLSMPSFDSPMKRSFEVSSSEPQLRKASLITRRSIIIAVVALLVAVVFGILLTCPETVENVRNTAANFVSKLPLFRNQPAEQPIAE